MAYEVIGKLVDRFETIEVNDSFRRREFIIEKMEKSDDREFVDYIRFQTTQKRCELLDKFPLNETLKVMFNIRGRKWESDGEPTYYTNLEAWWIEKVDEVTGNPISDGSEKVIEKSLANNNEDSVVSESNGN